MPEQDLAAPSFDMLVKGGVGPDDEELERNPRARSAKMRAGVRTRCGSSYVGCERAWIATECWRRAALEAFHEQTHQFSSRSFCALMGAFWLFQVKHEAKEEGEKIAILKGQIQDEKDALLLLKAEWSYLNRPQRIQRLTDEFLRPVGVEDD